MHKVFPRKKWVGRDIEFLVGNERHHERRVGELGFVVKDGRVIVPKGFDITKLKLIPEQITREPNGQISFVDRRVKDRRKGK
jgi:hypothetical protein